MTWVLAIGVYLTLVIQIVLLVQRATTLDVLMSTQDELELARRARELEEDGTPVTLQITLDTYRSNPGRYERLASKLVCVEVRRSDGALYGRFGGKR
jgi:hypothetical protein